MIITENIDFNRLKISPNIEPLKKGKFGQYLTPAPVSHFMASLFDDSWLGDIKLLEAGSGIGALFAAFVEEILNLPSPNDSLEIDAFEIDRTFENDLNCAMQLCSDYGEKKNIKVFGNIYIKDFIDESVNKINSPLFNNCELYSHAILNPPYKKIQNNSNYRKKLRLVGIETVNLYSAFIALAIKQLKNGGQLVAITPRSFCNGPYFKEFRKLLVKEMGIKKIHVFGSRNRAFKDDEVLQENIILHAIKGDFSTNVELSSSSDSNFDDLTQKIVEYEDVVQFDDRDYIINIPTVHQNESFQEYLRVFKYSLHDIGLKVSTGKVVDFRVKEHLRSNPQKTTAPLIYPMHFKEGFIDYPQKDSKKPNAIINNSETTKLFLPKGYYLLVKRFSAKEEKRRITVSIYDPERIKDDLVGFENHLNVFHSNASGLDNNIAKGLAVYLSSTFIDLYFRQFSGHTQINVSDLKKLPYPNIDKLKKIGKSIGKKFPSQDIIDEIIKTIIIKNSKFKGDNVVSVEKKIEEAIQILKELGFPRAQINDRSGLTLLALLSLKPDDKWDKAQAVMIGITPIMTFCKKYYKRNYAPNTRETFRRQTMHQFIQAGLVIENPDEPYRPINSPKWCYQITDEALSLIQKFKTEYWGKSLKKYLSIVTTLKDKYDKERKKIKIPVKINEKEMIDLTPGDHNILTKKIIEEFGPIYTPDGEVLYVGDTGDKFGYFNKKAFAELGINIDTHGKMPDVVIYYKEQDWIILLEAVTSHGPVDSKRRFELSELFKNVKDKLVYVTCFSNKSELAKYISEISWETEVWVADNPTHLIHFNGERFLGPYDK